MRLQCRQVRRRQISKAFSNAVSVDGAQLKGKDYRARPQPGAGEGLHHKGSGKPTRSEIGGERDHKDSGQGWCRISLYDDRRPGSSLFAGGTGGGT
jgi:hypothetical protein